MQYHVEIKGEGYVFAFKRAKKSEDINALCKLIAEDPAKNSDFFAQGPGMDAEVVVTDEDGNDIMEGIVDEFNCNEDAEGVLPDNLAEDEVVITYLRKANGCYINEDFDSPVELDDAAYNEDEETGLGGKFVCDSCLTNWRYVFLDMGIGDNKFKFLPVKPALGGARVRVWDNKSNRYFYNDEEFREKFLPLEELPGNIASDLKKAIAENEEDPDTDNAEDDIRSAISGKELDEFDNTEDRFEDGLYFTPAEEEDETSFELVVDGKVLFGYETIWSFKTNGEKR